MWCPRHRTVFDTAARQLTGYMSLASIMRQAVVSPEHLMWFHRSMVSARASTRVYGANLSCHFCLLTRDYDLDSFDPTQAEKALYQLRDTVRAELVSTGAIGTA